MEAIGALLGAVIGGVLVMAADVIRRRYEWTREIVRRLADASANLASSHLQICYNVRALRLSNSPLDDSKIYPPESYDAETRFYVSTGVEVLEEAANAMRDARKALIMSFKAEEKAWDKAWDSSYDAVKEFEREVRAIVARGHI